jgi:hypothetical protein
MTHREILNKFNNLSFPDEYSKFTKKDAGERHNFGKDTHHLTRYEMEQDFHGYKISWAYTVCLKCADLEKGSHLRWKKATLFPSRGYDSNECWMKYFVKNGRNLQS